jgi:excisionase family DNA binding protein
MESKPAQPSPFLTVNEVADLLRIDRKTVHKLIASGDLRHVRLGRVIRIPASALPR